MLTLRRKTARLGGEVPAVPDGDGEHVRREAVLAELGLEALRADSSRSLLRRAALVAADATGADRCEVRRPEGTNGRSRLVALASAGRGPVPAPQPLDPNLTLAGMAIAEREPVLVHDLRRARLFGVESADGSDPRGGVAVPIEGRNGAVGALVAYSSRPEAFSDVHVHFLRSVANIVSPFVEGRSASPGRDTAGGASADDHLTGLATRGALVTALEAALVRARSRGSGLALLFVDLDGFKLVNDGLGHRAGDEVLRAAAARLATSVRSGDLVARYGGDEFVILAEGVSDEVAATAAADRVLEAMREPFRVAGRPCALSASVGVALVDGSEDAEDALRDADMAMYRAKEAGRGQFVIFDQQMRAQAIERVELQVDLAQALHEDQLRLVYQPVADSRQGVVAVEALLRWSHPSRGLLPASQFVPAAEESGAIVPVGAWVLHEACRQGQAWRRQGRDLTMSVNLSPRELREPGLVDLVKQALRASGLPAPSLCVEVTEGSILPIGPAASALLELRRLGVRIAMDDFGSGYSSLSYIRSLPVDVVKIDRSFIEGLAHREERAIVTAVLSMAEVLGLTVIAEGVEHDDQLRWLEQLGCRLAQGYRLGAPAPAEEVALDAMQGLPHPGTGDPLGIREFMRHLGIPARIRT